MDKIKVNYRVTKDGEIIAVFIGRLSNGRYQCYSLYGGDHFEATEQFIRTCTRRANGYRISELNAFLINRGYNPIYVQRMIY